MSEDIIISLDYDTSASVSASDSASRPSGLRTPVYVCGGVNEFFLSFLLL